MKYKRAAIEIEAPEEYGYENIKCNLAESSVTDAILENLNIELKHLKLYYGDHRGLPQLREYIAQKYEGISANDVLITAGASSALFIIATSLLSSDDSLLVMHPNYATNLDTPRLIGCQINPLTLSFKEQFRFPLKQFEQLYKPDMPLISLTTPHNPTGQMMSNETIEYCLSLLSPKTIALFDETYRDIPLGQPTSLAAALSPSAISVSSLSKAFGLPGIRIGWIICRNPELMNTFLAAKEQIFITNSVVDEEIAYQFLLKESEHLAEVKKHIMNNLKILSDWIQGENHMEWVPPQGGVVCFPRIKPELNIDLNLFYNTLNEKYKTFVGPGHWFEMDRHFMRIGFGWPSAQELKSGLEHISQSIKASLPQG